MATAKARPCEEGNIRSVQAVSYCTASAKRWVLLVTVLASVIANVDESIVNVALPAIETDLATSAIVIQWLVNAYTLSVGISAGWRCSR